MHALDVTVLIAYLAGVLFLGYRAGRRSRSTENYIVAGRSLPPWMLGCTLAASLTGAGLTLGAAGSAYKVGASFLWMYLGYAAGMAVMGIVGYRMRVTRSESVGAIFGSRFGRPAQVAAAAVVFLYTFTLVGYSISGVTRVVSYIVGTFGAEVNLTLLTILITVVLALYTFFGGLFAVAWTDTVQLCLMLAGVVIVAPIVGVREAGGFHAVSAGLHAEGLELWNPLAGVSLAAAFTSFVVLFMSCADATALQRALAGNSPRGVRKGFLIAALLVVVWSLGLLITAGTGRVLLPNLVEDYGTSEALLPVFFLKLLPVGLTGIGLAALLAALMSTIDSFLLVVSITFFHDILKPLRPSLVSAERERGLIGAGVLGFGLLSLVVALSVSEIFDVMLFVLTMIGAALFLPLVARLWWRRVTTPGITAGIAIPALYILVAFAADYAGPGGDPLYLGGALSLAAIVLVSRATRRSAGYVPLEDREGK